MNRTDKELSYGCARTGKGIPVPTRLVGACYAGTPWLGLADAGGRDYRLTPKRPDPPDMSFSVEATRSERVAAEVEDIVMARF